MSKCQCGHSHDIHVELSSDDVSPCSLCDCKNFMRADLRGVKHRVLSAREDLILQVAFFVDDPPGLVEIELARAFIDLIQNSDPARCKALTSELRALRLKYRKETPVCQNRT